MFKKIAVSCAIALTMLVGSAGSHAYLITCAPVYGVPTVVGSWSQTESLVWRYYYYEYEYTYLPTGAYDNNDFNGTIPYNQANYIATWVANPSLGEWGMDGSFQLSWNQFEPTFQVHLGPFENCSGDMTFQ